MRQHKSNLMYIGVGIASGFAYGLPYSAALSYRLFYQDRNCIDLSE